jgi:hypothetical protein
MVGQFISEPEAMSKFKWQDPPNMGIILVRKITEKMLEEVCIWTGIKRQAESGRGEDSQQSR